MNEDICFAVRIQTYNRKKPRPIKDYVEEAIDCVKRQTYKNWKIFLIGDCYEPREEFRELVKLAPPDKIVAANTHCCPERIHSGYNLWCCGGVTTFNFSLDLMTELGFTHCANLDDDDLWFPRHLEYHAEGYRNNPNAVLVVTHGHFKLPNYVLPLHKLAPKPFWKNHMPQMPQSETTLKSIAANSCNCACSWDIQKMPLRAKNCIHDTGWAKQCWDYWFWRRFEEQAHKAGHGIIVLPQITVFQRHTHLKPMSVGHL